MDPVAAIDAHSIRVVLPRDSEHDLTFWLDDALKNRGFVIVLTAEQKGFEAFNDLANSLLEFRLGRVPLQRLFIDGFVACMNSSSLEMTLRPAQRANRSLE